MDIPNNNFDIGDLKEAVPASTGSEVGKVDGKDPSFKDMLSGLVQQVDSLQKEADSSIEGLATGKTTDVHDVTIKMEEAGIAFELMMEIRNKLIDAYQQILKMQS